MNESEIKNEILMKYSNSSYLLIEKHLEAVKNRWKIDENSKSDEKSMQTSIRIFLEQSIGDLKDTTGLDGLMKKTNEGPENYFANNCTQV